MHLKGMAGQRALAVAAVVAVLCVGMAACTSGEEEGGMLHTLESLVVSQETQIATLTQQVRTASRDNRRHFLTENQRLALKEREHQKRVEALMVMIQLQEGTSGEDEAEEPSVEAGGGSEGSATSDDTNSVKGHKEGASGAMRHGPGPKRDEVKELSKYVDEVKDSSYSTFKRLQYQLWIFQHRYKRKMKALKSYRKRLRQQQKMLEEYEFKVKGHLKGMRSRMKGFMSTIERITRHNKELQDDLADDKNLSAKFKTQLESQLRSIDDLQMQMEKMVALDHRLRGEQRDFTRDLTTLKSTLAEMDPTQKKLWAQEEAYQKAGVRDGQHLRQLSMGIQLLKRKHQTWQTSLLRKVTGKLESSQDMINTSIKRAGMLVDQARGEAARQLESLVGAQLGERVQGVEADLFEKEVANELKKLVAPQLNEYLSRQKILLDDLARMKVAAKTGKWEDPTTMFSTAPSSGAEEGAPSAEGSGAAEGSGTAPAAPSDGAASTPAPAPAAAVELLQLGEEASDGYKDVKCRCVQALGEFPEGGAPMHCMCDHY